MSGCGFIKTDTQNFDTHGSGKRKSIKKLVNDKNSNKKRKDKDKDKDKNNITPAIMVAGNGRASESGCGFIKTDTQNFDTHGSGKRKSIKKLVNDKNSSKKRKDKNNIIPAIMLACNDRASDKEEQSICDLNNKRKIQKGAKVISRLKVRMPIKVSNDAVLESNNDDNPVQSKHKNQSQCNRSMKSQSSNIKSNNNHHEKVKNNEEKNINISVHLSDTRDDNDSKDQQKSNNANNGQLDKDSDSKDQHINIENNENNIDISIPTQLPGVDEGDNKDQDELNSIDELKLDKDNKKNIKDQYRDIVKSDKDNKDQKESNGVDNGRLDKDNKKENNKDHYRDVIESDKDNKDQQESNQFDIMSFYNAGNYITKKNNSGNSIISFCSHNSYNNFINNLNNCEDLDDIKKQCIKAVNIINHHIDEDELGNLGCLIDEKKLEEHNAKFIKANKDIHDLLIKPDIRYLIDNNLLLSKEHIDNKNENVIHISEEYDLNLLSDYLEKLNLDGYYIARYYYNEEKSEDLYRGWFCIWGSNHLTGFMHEIHKDNKGLKFRSSEEYYGQYPELILQSIYLLYKKDIDDNRSIRDEQKYIANILRFNNTINNRLINTIIDGKRRDILNKYFPECVSNIIQNMENQPDCNFINIANEYIETRMIYLNNFNVSISDSRYTKLLSEDNEFYLVPMLLLNYDNLRKYLSNVSRFNSVIFKKNHKYIMFNFCGNKYNELMTLQLRNLLVNCSDYDNNKSLFDNMVYPDGGYIFYKVLDSEDLNNKEAGNIIEKLLKMKEAGVYNDHNAFISIYNKLMKRLDNFMYKYIDKNFLNDQILRFIYSYFSENNLSNYKNDNFVNALEDLFMKKVRYFFSDMVNGDLSTVTLSDIFHILSRYLKKYKDYLLLSYYFLYYTKNNDLKSDDDIEKQFLEGAQNPYNYNNYDNYRNSKKQLILSLWDIIKNKIDNKKDLTEKDKSLLQTNIFGEYSNNVLCDIIKYINSYENESKYKANLIPLLLSFTKTNYTTYFDNNYSLAIFDICANYKNLDIDLKFYYAGSINNFSYHYIESGIEVNKEFCVTALKNFNDDDNSYTIDTKLLKKNKDCLLIHPILIRIKQKEEHQIHILNLNGYEKERELFCIYHASMLTVV